MTDGILLAEIQSDRWLSALRHDHHRRGARAQPQHRLPARLPEAAAAQAPRPEGHRHLGDDRHRALRARTSAMRRWSMSKAAAIRSRCATARSEGEGDEASARTRAATARVNDAIVAAVRRDHARGSARRRADLPARRARDPRRAPGAGAAQIPRDRSAAAVRAAVGARPGPRVQSRARSAASCWRPMSPKPR